MERFISLIAVGIALGWSGGLASCSSDRGRDRDEEHAEQGSLTLPLEAVSASGKIYRLRQAVFPIQSFGFGPFPVEPPIEPFPSAGFTGAGGTAPEPFPSFDAGQGAFGAGGAPGSGGAIGFPGQSVVVLNSEDNPTRPTLETFLTPNSYFIQLLDGWFIEQVDDLLGTSAIVFDALLLSDPVQFFDIQADQETFVRYSFEVNGERIDFGKGRLIVGIDVTERNSSAFCGDGIVGPNEACDSFDLQGQTCASITLGALPFGSLFCSPFCSFDLSGCFSDGGGDSGTGGTGAGGSPNTGGGVNVGGSFGDAAAG